MIKICKECGKEFNADKKTRKFCSRECRCTFDRKQNRVIVKCNCCEVEFEKTKFQYSRSKNHYCSHECKSEHQKIIQKGENNPNFKNKLMSVECSNCGNKINLHECNLKNSNGTVKKNHYCSHECKSEHQKIIQKGENNPNFKAIKCNCAFCNKEMLRTENYIKQRQNLFCSYECYSDYMSKYLVGENNPNYDPSISQEDREIRRNFDGYAYWRREVYKIDSYTCQCCGDDKGSNLVAHHILNYSQHKELRTDINNGITLCKICHKEFHDTYGYRNNNQEQLNEFIYIKNQQASQ